MLTMHSMLCFNFWKNKCPLPHPYPLPGIYLLHTVTDVEQQSLPSHGRICSWCFDLAVHIQQGAEKVVHSERELVSGTASPIPTPSHYLYPYPITLSVSLPLHIIYVPCEIVLSLQYVRSAQVEFDGCTVLLFCGRKFSYKSVIAFMWFVFLFP